MRHVSLQSFQMGDGNFYTSSPMPGAGQVVTVGASSNGSMDYGESDDDLRREDIMFPNDSQMGEFRLAISPLRDLNSTLPAVDDCDCIL